MKAETKANSPLFTITKSIFSRGMLFILIWWALTDGATTSWWIGAPAILIAVGTSLMLLPPIPFVWYEFLKFLPFFFMHSLLGGIDVAWRAFHPNMPIDPDIIDYPTQLPPGLPQMFMANIINLLPGTLSTTLDQNVLKVHVLNIQKEFLTELIAVEISVAQMFGIPLKKTKGGQNGTI